MNKTVPAARKKEEGEAASKIGCSQRELRLMKALPAEHRRIVHMVKQIFGGTLLSVETLPEGDRASKDNR